MVIRWRQWCNAMMLTLVVLIILRIHHPLTATSMVETTNVLSTCQACILFLWIGPIPTRQCWSLNPDVLALVNRCVQTSMLASLLVLGLGAVVPAWDATVDRETVTQYSYRRKVIASTKFSWLFSGVWGVRYRHAAAPQNDTTRVHLAEHFSNSPYRWNMPRRVSISIPSPCMLYHGPESPLAINLMYGRIHSNVTSQLHEPGHHISS